MSERIPVNNEILEQERKEYIEAVKDFMESAERIERGIIEVAGIIKRHRAKLGIKKPRKARKRHNG